MHLHIRTFLFIPLVSMCRFWAKFFSCQLILVSDMLFNIGMNNKHIEIELLILSYKYFPQKHSTQTVDNIFCNFRDNIFLSQPVGDIMIIFLIFSCNFVHECSRNWNSISYILLFCVYVNIQGHLRKLRFIYCNL